LRGTGTGSAGSGSHFESQVNGCDSAAGAPAGSGGCRERRPRRARARDWIARTNGRPGPGRWPSGGGWCATSCPLPTAAARRHRRRPPEARGQLDRRHRRLPGTIRSHSFGHRRQKPSSGSRRRPMVRADRRYPIPIHSTRVGAGKTGRRPMLRSPVGGLCHAGGKSRARRLRPVHHNALLRFEGLEQQHPGDEAADVGPPGYAAAAGAGQEHPVLELQEEPETQEDD